MRPFSRENIQNLIILIVGFLLFMEWLIPLEIVTDTGNSHIFVIFSVVSFILYFFRVHFIITAAIHVGLVIYFIKLLYYNEFTNGWFSVFLQELTYSINHLINFQWFAIADSFRSVLFFFLLWLICYCVYYLIIIKNRFFIFFFLTVLYLATLDTFTAFSAELSIIRTIVFGLIILFYLTYVRIQKKEGLRINPFYWAFPFVILLLATTVFGYFLPKAGPQWPDPVPFIKKAVQVAGEEGGELPGAVRRIGYGVNDERLGGPFVFDDTLVFKAEVKERHYWKVETKDLYTGKGWVTSEDSERVRVDPEDLTIATFENSVKKESLDARVYFLSTDTLPHIVYSPELKGIIPEEQAEWYIDASNEKIEALKGGEPSIIQNYQIQYEYPTFSIPALRNVGDQDPVAIIEQYTQLPSELPERVFALAEEITAEADNRYDKVVEIEKYFRSGEYVYETKDVAVPDSDTDYVDQFLFETQKGYCDNFSSSMAVMLRTLDIPTRWVKGYTQGEYADTTDTEHRVYEITNSNAHSWVEVYFPNVGWVPVEPTRGFDSPYNFERNINSVEDRAVEEEVEQEEEEESEQEKVEEEEENQVGFSFLQMSNTGKYILAGLILLSLLIYVFRKRWLPYYFIYRLRLRNDDKVFSDAYQILMFLLKQKGYPIESGQTLREYAIKIDQAFDTTYMSELTNRYERYMYGHKVSSNNWNQTKELWENLVKKISA